MNLSQEKQIKEYELSGPNSCILDSNTPMLARIDGKKFSSFTKDLGFYDKTFSELMINTAEYLAKDFDARLAYTQSDEISLVWYNENEKSQYPFGGKYRKLNSVLASKATSFFLFNLFNSILSEKAKLLPSFDCRVWSVPSKTDACHVLLWRQKDCIRNSISRAADQYFSHKERFEKSSVELKYMLEQKGFKWEDCEDSFKYGTFFKKTQVERKLTKEEIDNLPAKHEARINSDIVFLRNEYVKYSMFLKSHDDLI